MLKSLEYRLFDWLERRHVKDLLQSPNLTEDSPLIPVTKPKGKVVKTKQSVPFIPDAKRRGGRMVKTMPRQLRKMQLEQEEKDATDVVSILPD